MGGPGVAFSRGQGRQRICREADDLTQPCAQGPVDQRPLSHPDLMTTCVPRSSEPGMPQFLREGGVSLSGLVYFILKYTAISCLSSAFYHPLPLLQYPIPCPSPDIPLILARHPELPDSVLPQDPPGCSCPTHWVGEGLGFLPEN